MTNDNSKLLDVYLAEYNSLRAEIIARTQTQNQVLNFLLIIIGAATSANVAGINAGINVNLILLITALLLPLITFPLAFIFFDAEIMIHAVGSHLHENLRKYIGSVVEADKLEGARLAFKSTLDFEHLNSTTKATQHWLSIGRWFIFLIPTLMPVLSLILYSLEDWGWWYKNLIPLSPIYSITLIMSGLIVFLIEILMSLLLLCAIIWTLNRCHELGRPTLFFSFCKNFFDI